MKIKNNVYIYILLGVISIFILCFAIYKLYPRVDDVVINITDDTSDIGDSNFELEKGEQYQLDYSVEGTSTKSFKATFESSNPEVATIDANGLITGIDEGTTKIKVTVGDKSNEVDLTIYSDNEDLSKAISNNDYKVYYNNRIIKEHLFINVNSTKELVIKKNNSSVKSGITWNVKDSSYVTVSNGKVTSKGKIGETIITAKIGKVTLTIPTVVEYSNNSNIYYLDTADSPRKYYGSNAGLVKTKTGKWGLVDAGQKGFCSRINAYIWDLNIKELEFVIISHLHADHYGCFKSIANNKNLKINKLYIKQADDVGKVGKDGLRTTTKKYNNLINIARQNNIEVKNVTPSENHQIYIDEMTVYLGNRHRIFAENGNLAKCNKVINGVRIGRCNENVESIVTMIKFHGSNRDSYSYLAADVQNKGMKNADMRRYAKFGPGKGINELFGPAHNAHLTYAGSYKNKKWTFYPAYNVFYSAEDIASCWARNIVARNTGKSEITCGESDVSKKRAEIYNNKLNIIDRLDVDLYQVSHHGANNSVTVFSYLNPKYAILTAGGGKGVDYYASHSDNNSINKLLYVGKISKNNIHYVGLGTVIYSVDEKGNMLMPQQLSDDD